MKTNTSTDLGKGKIGKLLLTFAIPCIISMLINSVYNIVDQIFIGQGVGYLGNAATNVIFPLVIIFTSLALLIGNGCAAFFSLKLGEKNYKEAKKSVGSSITVLFLVAIVLGILAHIFLPKLVNLFGCTENVYPYAMQYGRIIAIGAPFMIIYTGLAAIIRADGAPRYAMISVVIGAVINIILDPIFIFTFDLGVEGGAWATVIGQVISCIITVIYIFRIKSVKLEKSDFKPDKSIFKIMGYGLSSFITQITVLLVFVVMNNVMTKYGALSKYGEDIPLSVFGIVSKMNQVYIAIILGIACGAQPIIGFNYGAENFDRVKKVIKRVIQSVFIVGIVFNLLFVLFPSQLVSIFGSSDNELYLEFATNCCRIFMMICFVNSFDISAGILIQSLGNVKKAAAISITRQVILFIPIVLIMSSIFGLNGALWAQPISDSLAFIVVSIIFITEYRKIGKKNTKSTALLDTDNKSKENSDNNIIITINREYGSGGRYVGKMLADSLGIKFYDKDLIKIISKETGWTEEYIESNEETRRRYTNIYPEYNEDDKLFIAESEAIREISSKGSCVIIGRCADYILKEHKNIFRVFIYSNDENKIERAVNYYKIPREKALKEINKKNKERASYYKHYTGKDWKDVNNYDLSIDTDYLGIEETAELIKKIVLKNIDK